MPRICSLPWLIGSLLLGAVPPLLAETNQPHSEPVTFEKQIRPILKAHCFQCHGEEKTSGKLDVRLRRLIVAGGESGPAIEPGLPAASYLLDRVILGEMPPSGKKLPAGDIALIRRWIEAGAPTMRPEPENFDPHQHEFSEEERNYWAFQPVSHPEVPAVKGSASVRTPIDAFLLHKLEAKGLAFSPEADRRALLRRAYFDLLGLPPTPDEVEAFLADEAPDAYDRLIDRLLTRPEYGERWGRHWLDIAGYADSDGYTADDSVRKYAYKFRDYVIRSFNADKPLDQFIREQLAGDEIVPFPRKNLTPEQVELLVATGFLRMAPDGTASAEVDQNVARNHVMSNTLKIVSTSLLGLTVGCAECHNHRYDPITQEDYYRLRAIFEPSYDWKNWRTPPARLISLATDAERAESARLTAEAAKITAERDKTQAKFIAKQLEIEVARLPEEHRGAARKAYQTPVAKRTPAQQKLLKEFPSVGSISGGSLYLYDRERQAEVRTLTAKRTARQTELIAAAKTKHPKETVDAASLSQFDANGAAELQKLDGEIAAVKAEIGSELIAELTKQANEILAKRPVEDFVAPLTEVPGSVPETALFSRGDWQQPRQSVAPGEPQILTAAHPDPIPPKDEKLPTTGRRTELARRLTDGKHPLTARVLVNRVWLLHFGRGIVGTPADFGQLGERPSHPELLDYLASDLVSSGWRLKQMHKAIMTSTAYRQASHRTPADEMADPENRLLGRMNVRRVEAEVIRDSILAVSGKLSRKQFGPPVPVMPDEVGQVVIGVDTRDTAGRPSGKVVSLGDAIYRRSIYVQVRRSMPLGMLDAFDAPTPEPNCELRNASTVAPQSLMLMNNEFLVEQAGFFADRVKREAPAGPEAQVKRAWQLALGRAPDEGELKAAQAFLQQQAASFAPKAKEDKADPTAQALTSFCQALLSANEFLYID